MPLNKNIDVRVTNFQLAASKLGKISLSEANLTFKRELMLNSKITNKNKKKRKETIKSLVYNANF